MKKILLITPTSGQVIGFRAKLIETLQQNEYEVSTLTFDREREQEIESKNIKFYCVEDKNRSLDPFKILSLKNKYCKIIKEVRPDIVFTFMLKPNTFGVLAAKKAGVKNIYSMVEGAGDVFINNGLKWKVIRKVVCSLYKKAFKNSKKVFFLNNDDKAEFIQRKLVKAEQCEIIHGIGVDLEKFAYKPIKNNRTFLMVARMLKTKGVYEYCKCARIVKQKYPDAVFNYLGAEGTVTLADIKEYVDDGSINYLGTTIDVRPYYEDCCANILPSYREGFGLVIAESGATGRMSIAFDVQGTRDAVSDGYSGVLVKEKNIESLAVAATWCIENPQKVEEMGRNARKYAEENFDEKKINAFICSELEKLTNCCEEY